MLTETIAAIATALSNSGISIIRISGKDSLKIINKIFKTNAVLKPNSIVYGKIYKEQIVLDHVLVSYFKGPHSFTGEDVCEINCHGGNQITMQILELVLDNGAVLAEPGEFSKRAFLNGKMDLSQAEAVINLINAKTRTSSKVAALQLEGSISNTIKELREELIELLAHIEVSIDYPEYDYDEVENNQVLSLLDSKIEELKKIVNTYEQGKYIKDGVNVAILGKPNVGKSSLLNKFANYDKAIVTNIPGTTRDVVEETINLGEIILNISDTAGIRKTDDVVEKMGVEKSLKKLDEVDLVIYIIDVGQKIDEDEINMISKIQNKGVKLITVINKMDEVIKLKFDAVLEQLERLEINNPIKISIAHDEGIENLKKQIKQEFIKSDFDFEKELLITNSRHKELIKDSIKNLESAKSDILKNEPIDIISIVVKKAAKQLGEIIGTDVNVDVVNKIFEKFCLGK